MVAKSVTDWPVLKIAFVHQKASLADLALQYGLKLATVRKRCEREGWTQERIAAEQVAVAAAASTAATQRVTDLLKFNSDDLKIARAIRAKVAARLGTRKEGEPDISLADLRIIAATAEAAQRMGRLALGASTDNVGHAGPGGEGPVTTATVSEESYLEARKQALTDF